MAKKIESRTKKTTKRAPKRTAKPAKKTTTTDKLARLKAAEQRAVIAYRDGLYDLHPNLSLARRLRDLAAKLTVGVRELVSPGPDHGGIMRGTQAAADVAGKLEHEAKWVERDVLKGEVAS